MSDLKIIAIYIVIMAVVTFLIDLFAGPEGIDDVPHSVFALFWPVFLTFLCGLGLWFVFLKLPQRFAIHCHKLTTPPKEGE